MTMTREEAIEILEEVKMLDDSVYQYNNMYLQALDMAIKVLAQEPCEDAIRREELLKAIDTWDKFGVDDTNSLFRLDNLSLPHYVPYIHYDDVVKCIKCMPPVTPAEKVGHWVLTQRDKYIDINCSECGHTRIKEYAYNYTVDEIDMQEIKDLVVTNKMNYCECCGAKM